MFPRSARHLDLRFASRATLLLAATLSLAGCATGTTSARESWQGATYDDAVTHWGTPVRSTSLSDGRMAYTWHSEGNVSRASVWPTVGISAGSGVGVGVGVGVGAGASREVRATCERTLIFKDGRVTDQTWEGPADFCYQFRKR